MTHPLPKILFDECIGKPHIDHLAKLVSISEDAAAEIKHVLDFQPQGVWDEAWVPRIKPEGWLVITADKSKQRGGKGAPLSRVCLANHVTHIILSRRVGQRKSFDKMLTVLSLWYEIIQASWASPGARYMIEPVSMEIADRGRGKLLLRNPQIRGPRTLLYTAEEISLATTAPKASTAETPQVPN